MPHHHHSREEIAKIEIGHTETTPTISLFLTLVFAVVVLSVPLLQATVEIREYSRQPGRGRQAGTVADAARLLPSRHELRAAMQADFPRGTFASLRQMNARMLRDITVYERELKERSSLVQWLIPHVQTVITGVLKGGTEDAYCGRGGWLFYRRDIDYLTARGFLDPEVLAQRAAEGNEWKSAPQPDPVAGIRDFHEQLAKRGIQLVVVPVPVKPMIYPEQYSRRAAGPRAVPLQNPSYGEFLSRLSAAGVIVFDPAPLLARAKADSLEPLYLESDTHWTPHGMELAANALGDFVRKRVGLPGRPAPRYATVDAHVQNLGDVAAMLRLPDGQSTYRPEAVTIRQVTEGTHFWRPDAGADVLLLGDSFANIFSLEPMGWGEAAGFAEQLSLALGRPVDTILRNDAGSWSTREMLARELRRGHDRLTGKAVVIWEFAARELACGDWKRIPLDLGERGPSGFFTPTDASGVAVWGVVRSAAPAPRPGTVPYKDHIIMVHLAELESDDPAVQGRDAVVLMWSMKDNVWTPAARCRSGDRVRMVLHPWSAVSAKLEPINRAELTDDDLMEADPCWGEELEP